jgi:hypothetical protein
VTDLTLHTASWTAVHRYRQTFDDPKDMGFMPVRASVGLPRFWTAARAFPVAKLLTPYGLRKLTGDEFRNAYIARLEKAGVDAIRAELADIADAYGKSICLLCFEADPAACHRSTFAAFWRERTGDQVSEWAPRRRGGAVIVGSDPDYDRVVRLL